jgi:hypothetical protein
MRAPVGGGIEDLAQLAGEFRKDRPRKQRYRVVRWETCCAGERVPEQVLNVAEPGWLH